MTLKEAVKVLILSPFYFKLGLHDRKMLVKDFRTTHTVHSS